MRRSGNKTVPVRYRIQEALWQQPSSTEKLSSGWTFVAKGVLLLLAALAVIVVVGLALLLLSMLLHGIVYMLDNPAPEQAQYFLEVFGVFAIAVNFFAIATSGILSPMWRQRRLQQYMPLLHSQIIRDWLRERVIVRIVLCSVWCTLIALAWAAAAPSVFLLTQTLWMICLFGLTSRLGYNFASQAGQLGRVSTLVLAALKMWIIVSVTASLSPAIFAVVCPIYWFVAFPGVLAQSLGAGAGLAVIAPCSLIVAGKECRRAGVTGLARTLWVQSPSRRQLYTMSRQWRNLPDREEFPCTQKYYWKQPDENPSGLCGQDGNTASEQAAIAASILASMDLHSKHFVETQVWRKFRVGSLLVLLVCLAIQIINVLTHWAIGERFTVFYPLFLVVAPTAWALGRAGRFLQYGIVDIESLYRSARRTLVFDFASGIIIGLVPVAAICLLQQSLSPLLPLPWSIAVLVLVGLTLPLLVRMQFEAINGLATICSFFLPLYAAMLLMFAISKVFPTLGEGVAMGCSFGAALSASLLTFLIGWDRIAKRVKPRADGLLEWIRPFWPFS